MIENEGMKHGLYMPLGLSQDEYLEIEKLAGICEKHDKISLKQILNFDMLIRRPVSENNDFLFYEDGYLVGYIGIYSMFKETEVEAGGMVHPDYRGKGVLGILISKARERCTLRGIENILLVTDRLLANGRFFAESIGAQLEFSEYNMALNISAFKGSTLTDSTIQLKKVQEGELYDLALIGSRAFNSDINSDLAFMKKVINIPQRIMFAAEYDMKKVGMITILYDYDAATIYGFAVDPDYQRRGLGRQILIKAVNIALENGAKKVNIEVETENVKALSLYASCGFEVDSIFDYYRLNL
jgi:ribosomal protein S18 acetylase RimI-like enzyme